MRAGRVGGSRRLLGGFGEVEHRPRHVHGWGQVQGRRGYVDRRRGSQVDRRRGEDGRRGGEVRGCQRMCLQGGEFPEQHLCFEHQGSGLRGAADRPAAGAGLAQEELRTLLVADVFGHGPTGAEQAAPGVELPGEGQLG